MFPKRSRNLFSLCSLKRLLTTIKFCCFIHVKETSLGVLTIFLLVSCRYLLVSSDSLENQPSSFPPLLTALVFILLADGRIVAITQIREEQTHCRKRLRAKRKMKKTYCSYVKTTTNNFTYIATTFGQR